MWFILYCDEDNSHSIIHDKFVLNVAGVEKNDKVSYFYRNKPYIGTVVDFSGKKSGRRGFVSGGWCLFASLYMFVNAKVRFPSPSIPRG